MWPLCVSMVDVLEFVLNLIILGYVCLTRYIVLVLYIFWSSCIMFSCLVYVRIVVNLKVSIGYFYWSVVRHSLILCVWGGIFWIICRKVLLYVSAFISKIKGSHKAFIIKVVCFYCISFSLSFLFYIIYFIVLNKAIWMT